MSQATVAAAARRRESLSPTSTTEVDPVEDFQRKTGLSRHAFRAAVRAELRVRRAHTRAYIAGVDWLAYLDNCGESETSDGLREVR